MVTWMKKAFTADGVTEYPPGPHLNKLQRRFGLTGAVMLLLDVSYSMKEDLPRAVSGSEDFIDEAVGGGYDVGIVLWSTDVRAYAVPESGGRSSKEILRQADVGGGTDVVPALTLAGDLLLSLDVPDRVIAIFSDGALSNRAKATEVASSYAAQGVRILTLGLGEESARNLRSLSTESDGGLAVAQSSTLGADIRTMASRITKQRMRTK